MKKNPISNFNKDQIISVDASDLKRLGEELADFSAQEGAKVLNRVLNKTLTVAKVEIARKVSEVYAIPISKVKKAIDMQPLKRTNILSLNSDAEFGIVVRGNHLSASQFAFTPRKPPENKFKTKKDGEYKLDKNGKRILKNYSVTLTIFRGQKTKVAPKNIGGVLKNPFVSPKPERRKEQVPFFIYHRTGEKRSDGTEKMESMTGPAIPEMVLNPKVAEPLVEVLSERMGTLITQEINFKRKYEK